MSVELKLRRGSTLEHSTFIGAEGEVTYDTDKKILIAHDGVTAGGHPIELENKIDEPAMEGTAGQALVTDGAGGRSWQTIEPSSNFTDLDDTPADYTGHAGKVPVVKTTEDGLEFITPVSEIPMATEATLGGVMAKAKTGETTEVAIDPLTGKLYVPESGGSYTLPQATETELGGVKAKARTSENNEVAIDETTGKLYAPESGGSYSLPQASETVLGGIKAKEKTTESTEVAIDPLTGKLYVPEIGSGLPAGGQTGYFLKKNSAADGDVSWTNPPIKLASPGGVIFEDFEGDTFKLPTTHTANVVRTTGGRSGMCMYRPYIRNGDDNLTITIESLFGGKVSFYYKTRMESPGTAYNRFQVTDNGVAKLSTNATVSSWTYFEFDISPGLHTFKFYQSIATGGRVEFWIDDITFPANWVEGMDALYSNPDSLLVVDSSGLTVGFIPKRSFITAPETEGTAGQVLMTDGAGGRSWGDIVHPTQMVGTGTELPTADISYRGQIFTVLGDVGVADTSYICRKDTTDTYIWTPI